MAVAEPPHAYHIWQWVVQPNPNKGSGCMLIVIGMGLMPVFLIGLPILLYGLWLNSEKYGFWQCQYCGLVVHHRPKPYTWRKT